MTRRAGVMKSADPWSGGILFRSELSILIAANLVETSGGDYLKVKEDS